MGTVTIILRSDHDARRREVNMLYISHNAGLDLGPRGPHIRAIGQNLQEQIITLRKELKYLATFCDLLRSNGIPYAKFQQIEIELNKLVEEIASQVRAAVEYNG